MCGGTLRVLLLMPNPHGLSPRVRGTSDKILSPKSTKGLSPRVRGNLLLRSGDCFSKDRRSIPACAGEPSRLHQDMARFQQGLSPRVRGNRALLGLTRLTADHHGSIPACAGEPGGILLVNYRGYDGLSPRVRGNHGSTCCYPGILHDGSIPACAGEPHSMHHIPGIQS